LQAYSSNVSSLPHCGRILTLTLLVRCLKERSLPSLTLGRTIMMKTLIIGGATLALVTAAGAADLPQRQPVPVYKEAPVVGKMPIGKSPVGKSPVGKSPVVARY
jgi:hypothetical protein